MAVSDIRRCIAPQPSVRDYSGPIRAAAWTLRASNEADAESGMADYVGLGVPYTLPDGSIPDELCTCHSHRVTTLVSECPATASDGLYRVEGIYTYAQLESAALWRREPSVVSKIADVDKYGNPICTAAGEMYDPPRTYLAVEWTWIREWLEFAESRDAIEEKYGPYITKMNADTFRGKPPGSVLCIGVDPTDIPGFGGYTQLLFRMVARFQYSEPKLCGGVVYRGWDEAVIHWGYHIIGADGKPVPYKDPTTGQGLARPAPLTADGHNILPSGSPVNYRLVEHYWEANLTGMFP